MISDQCEKWIPDGDDGQEKQEQGQMQGQQQILRCAQDDKIDGGVGKGNGKSKGKRKGSRFPVGSDSRKGKNEQAGGDL